MLRSTRNPWRSARAVAILLLAVALAAVPVRLALAEIMGGEGNKPLSDPGWPAGAAAIFNHPGRIAWWEGPPFGGGEWHAECRGDTKAFNAVLADFAKLDIKSKRLVVHDGVGGSVWLNMNGEPAKKAAAQIDWVFLVWQPSNWEHLQKLPSDLHPSGARDAAKGPPSQIDLYTGGNIKWSEVTVPEGLAVDDQRMEAHGFTPADGVVFEGKAFDLATKQPLAARMKLQRYEPDPKGGFKYTVAAESRADAKGHWLLKKVPAGGYRVVIEADGFVPRIAGHATVDDQPRWQSYECGLARPAPVSGRILDDAGQPLADVDVHISNVVADSGERYESSAEYSSKTDADGRFHCDQVPKCKATVWVHKPGYVRAGLGQAISTPKTDVALSMNKAGRIEITVDFGKIPRPDGYMIHMQPEGGEAIGKWSGSGNIDAKNRIVYDNVPPGKYVVHGRPNPGNDKQQTKPLPVELKGGETTAITLEAKLTPPPPPPDKPKPKVPETSNEAF